MKIAILNKEGKKTGDFEIKLSSGDIREDIFKKAVLAESSLFFQPKGADPMAGKKVAINLSKRRRKLRTTYGRGGSRTPKKVMWSRGTQFRFVGAFAPNTVGGRKAHPPKSGKNYIREINNKEWLKAFQTGFIASLNKNVVEANGQKIPETYPFILDNDVEEILKTKDFKSLLEKLGYENELKRVSEVKIRAGRGTMRSRRYKTKRGPLVVVSDLEKPVFKAAKNIKGFDIITPELLMVSDFGMNINPGRAIIFTKSAIEQLKEVIE